MRWLVILLSGCTVIGSQVEDWPDLKVTRHDVPHAKMRDVCGPATPIFSGPVACSTIDLTERRCDMYFSADFPPTETTVEHEQEHCTGKDHPGSTQLRDYLRTFQKGK